MRDLGSLGDDLRHRDASSFGSLTLAQAFDPVIHVAFGSGEHVVNTARSGDLEAIFLLVVALTLCNFGIHQRN